VRRVDKKADMFVRLYIAFPEEYVLHRAYMQTARVYVLRKAQGAWWRRPIHDFKRNVSFVEAEAPFSFGDTSVELQ
jgi:hypothetical protein